MRRGEILKIARSWLGTPYHHQASAKGAGCDCVGLIRGIYTEVTGRAPEDPPPYSRDWAEASGQETMLETARRYLIEVPIAQAKPGDVVVFRMRSGALAKHAGLLSAADKMIHSQEGVTVSEVHLGLWWRRRIVAAFKFPNIED